LIGLVHIDVFSGIGGMSLAAEMAGFETVLHCDTEPFCRNILARHWPESHIHDDIRTLTAEKDSGARAPTSAPRFVEKGGEDAQCNSVGAYGPAEHGDGCPDLQTTASHPPFFSEEGYDELPEVRGRDDDGRQGAILPNVLGYSAHQAAHQARTRSDCSNRTDGGRKPSGHQERRTAPATGRFGWWLVTGGFVP
jgi:hypothetical protein